MLKCFLPFKERSMWANYPGGFRISPCCKIPGIEYTEEDITNIKKELYSSEKNIPNECSYCWNAENKGLISWRHNEGVVPKKWKDENLLEHTRGNLISHLKIMFDSTCDCACVYCDANNSTIWNKEVTENNVLVKNLLINSPIYDPKEFENPTDKQHYIRDYLEYLGSEIYKYENHFNLSFLGGEPFLSPALKDGKFIDYIDSFYKHAPKDFSLIYEFNTNCNTPTSLIDKHLKLIEKYKEKYPGSKPKIIISGEAYGTALEYVRYGTNHKQYMKNIEKYFSKPWLQLSINLAMNVFCIPSLHKHLEFIFGLCEKYNQTIGITPGCVHNPNVLHPCVLPKEFNSYVDLALDQLNTKYISSYDSIDNIKIVLDNLKMQMGSQSNLTPQLKKYVKYFRTVRNMNIQDYVPELKFLNE